VRKAPPLLQELHQAVERERRLEMQRRRQNAKRACEISGCSANRRMASTATAGRLIGLGCASAIRNGTMVNIMMLSKQKISATGTAARAPSVASARPGPHIADIAVATSKAGNGRFRDIPAAQRHADGEGQRKSPEGC
jgi:hypothetical protein